MSSVSLPSRRALWLAPLLVFALTLLVTAVLLASTMASIEDRDRAAFESEVTRTTDAVRERLDTTITLLRGASGLFAGSTQVIPAEFRAYVGELRLRERYPGILGIGFSERIVAARLQERVQQIRESGRPDFRVWPEEPREEYHAIVFIEPMDARNATAVGFDMFTDATRREAMSRAALQGREAASGKVMLVQEIDAQKQPGFLVYLPIYRGRNVPASEEERRRELRGFVYAPLRVGDLLVGVRGGGVRSVDYELFDGSMPDPAALLRSTRQAGAPAPTFQATRTLDVGGRTWLLRFGSRPAFEALSQRHLVPWLALASLATAVLLAWITFVQARARRGAEAASARRDEFLAVLAHELRNPLAPIRTSLEVLRRVPEGPRAARALEVAQRQVSVMVRLIDDLLDVSRISRGKIALQPRDTVLASVVAAAVETSRPLLDQRGHALQVGTIDPALQLRIDPARIAQVLTNLLNNAANYTPPGGRIAIEVEETAEEVLLRVRDNGIGIEADKLRSIFDMFVQAQQSVAGGGLGIGLGLAARLAQLHGGRVEARSDGPGQGSEFTLVLPRVPRLPRESAGQAPPPA